MKRVKREGDAGGPRARRGALLHQERVSSFVGNRISFFLHAFPDLSAEVWANTSSILVVFNLCDALFTDGWHYAFSLLQIHRRGEMFHASAAFYVTPIFQKAFIISIPAQFFHTLSFRPHRKQKLFLDPHQHRSAERWVLRWIVDTQMFSLSCKTCISIILHAIVCIIFFSLIASLSLV